MLGPLTGRPKFRSDSTGDWLQRPYITIEVVETDKLETWPRKLQVIRKAHRPAAEWGTEGDCLDDVDDVTANLEIALEGSAQDPTAVPRALGVIARSQNMSELARRVGMSRDGLHKALSADGDPT